ncbi:MAG: hypothetical protein BWY70_01647 [Bacteroidetes bacterium ADurb.Bin408]|nr:MAG: hypothetical protein BWY70_01647 [Bacteroidetes bacterium ADurb.Bin408]
MSFVILSEAKYLICRYIDSSSRRLQSGFRMTLNLTLVLYNSPLNYRFIFGNDSENVHAFV